jgi:putative cell wall-binding protein
VLITPIYFSKSIRRILQKFRNLFIGKRTINNSKKHKKKVNYSPIHVESNQMKPRPCSAVKNVKRKLRTSRRMSMNYQFSIVNDNMTEFSKDQGILNTSSTK